MFLDILVSCLKKARGPLAITLDSAWFYVKAELIETVCWILPGNLEAFLKKAD